MQDLRHKTWELATPSDEIDAIRAAVKAQVLIVVPTEVNGAFFMHPFDLHLFYEDTSMDDLDEFTEARPTSVREFVSHDWIDSHYDVIASVTTH